MKELVAVIMGASSGIGKAAALEFARSGINVAVATRTAKTFAAQVRRDHFQDKPASPTDGNLFKPMDGTGSVSGGWK